jgi:transposase
MRCGILSNRSCRFDHGGQKVGGLVSLIARASPAVFFVLRTGLPWQMLPQELGCGSGMTCWRRLRDWQLAGVWDLINFALLDWLARDDLIDWSRAVVDSCSIRAVCGGDQTVQIPPIGPSAEASVI